MTELNVDSSTAEDDAIAELAIAWFARLRAADVTANEKQQFACWYQANQAHSHAYDEIAAFWDDADFVQILADNPQPAAIVPLRRSRFKHARAITLALAACLALVAVIYRPYSICLQADYCTGVGEIRSVALADGSQITLNSGTALSVDLNNGKRQVRLQRGEAFFDVKRNLQQPFVVDAHYSTTRVLGTRFVVREDSKSDSVTVVSGLVEVSGKRRPPTRLAANDSISVDAKHSSELRQVAAINAIAWLKGSAAFDNATLADVIAEISRYRRGSIVIKDDAVKNLKISGRFDISNTDKALEALQQTLPIRIYQLTPWLVIIT